MILGSGLIQAANTFVGAYDAIPSIAAAYSTRRLLTSYTGPLLRLVADRAGYPEQDIGYTAAGDLDTASAASFLSGDSGYVTKWYDQSGNTKNLLQSILAVMPLYVASGQNLHPVLRSVAATRYMSVSAFAVVNTTMVVSGVPLETPSGYETFVGQENVGSDIWIGYSNADNGTIYASGNYYTNGAGPYASGTANDAYPVQNDPKIYSVVTVSALAAGTATILARPGGSNPLAADIFEMIVISAATAGPRQAAESAANAYWSIY